MKEKFYYMSSDGKKKKYIGKVIDNKNGTYNGVITNASLEMLTKDLIFHPSIESIEGYHSYYSYINSEGIDIKYYDNVKIDENENPYFTYYTYNIINLTYHPYIAPVNEYYTYIDKDGEEKVFEGKVKFDRRSGKYLGEL